MAPAEVPCAGRASPYESYGYPVQDLERADLLFIPIGKAAHGLSRLTQRGFTERHMSVSSRVMPRAAKAPFPSAAYKTNGR